MRKDTVRSKLFTRRALILLGMKALLFIALIARLYFLQVIKASKYKMLSDSNRIRLSIIPPLRGNLLDRFGQKIAANQNYYRVLFDVQQAQDAFLTLNRLGQLLGFNYQEQQDFIKRIKEKKPFRGTMLLYDHLTWEQVARVSVYAPELPGISIDVAQIRHYPHAESTSHVLGYVNTVSKEDKAGKPDDPLYAHPDFKIGKRGVEKTYEDRLRGEKGVRQLEVNAHGLPIRELSRTDSIQGHDLNLTIDINLQNLGYELLDKRGGSAVIMDITNGDVLALCSTPGFDPNKFAYGISPKDWKVMITDEYRPLVNRVIAEKYPPGSTFKIVTAMMLQSEGANVSERVFCPGYYQLGNRKFHCWKKGGHGDVDLHGAIKGSCNVYFFTMGNRFGIDKIIEMAKKFGFGERTGIDLPGEIEGTLPSREWKERTFQEPWQKGDTLNVSIGQGLIAVTPIQLAVMVARLASGGKKVVPNLIAGRKQEPFESLGLPPDDIARVMSGMNAVMNEPGGTAYGSRIPDAGMEMAGKTGTSQVVSRAVNEDKKDSEIDWKNRNHALFVGFAPVSNPRYAISVVVEHGISGSKGAAPIGKKLMLEAEKRDSARAPNPFSAPSSSSESPLPKAGENQ